MEKQPFDSFELTLFPRIKRVAGWLARHASPLPQSCEVCLSEHRNEE